MSFLKFLAPAVFALVSTLTLTPSASAQNAVYGAVALSNYCLQSNGSEASCKSDTVGLSAGDTFLFRSASRLKAGIDARIDASPGDRGGEAFLAALRFTFVPRENRLSPYFQIGGGAITTTYPSVTCTFNGFSSNCITSQSRKSGGAITFAVGLNVRAGEHLFIRPVELMGSAGSTVGHATFGSAVGYSF